MTINYVKDFKFAFEVGTENSVFIGAHFQGKTYAAANLIALPLLGVYRQWAWDYHGRVYLELTKQRLTPRQSQMLNDSRKRMVSDLGAATTFLSPPLERSEHYFLQFCALVCKQHDMHVIVDEIHNYTTAHSLSGLLGRVVRDMGNRNVSYTAIFQRPAEVHKSIISNAKHRFMFAFDVPTDIDYMRRWIGAEADLFLAPQLRRFYKDEPQLPPRSFIYRNQDDLTPTVVVGGLKL